MGLFGPSRKEIVKERYEEKAKQEAEERAKAEGIFGFRRTGNYEEGKA